jgi:predicted PurR-regulated permease PerM
MSSDDASLRRGQLSTRALALLLLSAGVVLYFAIDLLLLLFAGVLLAIFLRTLAEWISRYTRLSPRWALLVVLLVLLGLGVGFARFSAPQLAEQVDQLAESVPHAVAQLTDRLERYSWGRWLVDQVRSSFRQPGRGDRGDENGRGGAGAGGPGPDEGGGDARDGGRGAPGDGGAVNGQQIVSTARTLVASLTSAIISLVIILFVGLYLAFDPETYRRGLLRLVPKQRRRRGAEVLAVVGHTLRWWLFGQLLAMVVVGLLMGIGLAVLGVPLALALGVLAGLLEFVPTFGPPIAFIPALLLAFQEATNTGLWVLGLYGVVQTLEAYILTPLIQQRAVELPPVLTISAQVLLGSTLGVLGLLVAVPLVAVVVVVVKLLYVQDKLGDDLEVDGEQEASKETRRDPKAVP